MVTLSKEIKTTYERNLYKNEEEIVTHGVSKVNGPKVAKFLDR